MALESYCAACTHLGEKVDYNGKYYCSKKGDVYASDPKCYNFCEAYGRSTSARENMYSNSKSHQSGGCYLTTAMCEILGYSDDNYYLQTLRNFRDQTLKKDIKYWSLLLTYDALGPIIATNLKQDNDKELISKTLMNKYINNAVTAIEHNKTEEAVNTYIAMTTTLAERYNINTNILNFNLENIDTSSIDINSLGHGRTKIKTINETN